MSTKMTALEAGLASRAFGWIDLSRRTVRKHVEAGPRTTQDPSTGLAKEQVNFPEPGDLRFWGRSDAVVEFDPKKPVSFKYDASMMEHHLDPANTGSARAEIRLDNGISLWPRPSLRYEVEPGKETLSVRMGLETLKVAIAGGDWTLEARMLGIRMGRKVVLENFDDTWARRKLYVDVPNMSAPTPQVG